MTPMNVHLQRQRGVALLVALLVVALAVILIAALLDRGELALARTRNVLRSEQAEAYAQGLEIYAAQILVTTTAGQEPDTNGSPWALPLPPQPVPGGIISAMMHDMNGCFNLNNLAPKDSDSGRWLPMFKALLTNRGIEPNLADAIQAWLDPATSSNDTGYYLALPTPYRPRRDVFVHVSELRLVRGVSGDVYARLAPYVCALPPGTKINVNTASVPVLQSLGVSQAVAEKLWNNGHAQFKDLMEFSRQIGPGAPPLSLAMFGIASTYFLARGDIVLDDVPFTFYSLIERGNGSISVIQRSRGSDDALVAPVLNDAGDSASRTLE